MLFDNPVLFALMAYGLTLIIALMVAGMIAIIGWAVKPKGAKAIREE